MKQQVSSRGEMEGGIPHSTLEELQQSEEHQHHHHHHQQQQHQYQDSQNDDFLNQMLSNISNCSWPPTPHEMASPSSNPTNNNSNNNNSGGGGGAANNNNPNQNIGAFDEASLVSKLRQQQMNEVTAKSLLLQHQQQFLMSRRSPGDGSSGGGSAAAAAAMLPLPLGLHNADSVDPSSAFKSQGAAEAAVQALYNGFAGSLQPPTQQQHFHPPPPPPPQGGQSFGAQAPPASAASTGGSSGAAAPQRQRVRARRGQATDPHSIAERLRRERIAERMKGLQELVPNANKTDKASMLDEIIDYVKFLQLQVKVLSMSRLGGAAAVAPLVADMNSEDGVGRSSNGNQAAAATTNDSMTVTEHQVAKLMEEDMGSAMQYLQGKGLCLMPISLATAISTATSISRNPLPPPTRPHINGNGNGNHHHILPSISSSNGEGDNSANAMSIIKANPTPDPSLKDPSN